MYESGLESKGFEPGLEDGNKYANRSIANLGYSSM